MTGYYEGFEDRRTELGILQSLFPDAKVVEHDPKTETIGVWAEAEYFEDRLAMKDVQRKLAEIEAPVLTFSARACDKSYRSCMVTLSRHHTIYDEEGKCELYYPKRLSMTKRKHDHISKRARTCRPPKYFCDDVSVFKHSQLQVTIMKGYYKGLKDWPTELRMLLSLFPRAKVVEHNPKTETTCVCAEGEYFEKRLAKKYVKRRLGEISAPVLCFSTVEGDDDAECDSCMVTLSRRHQIYQVEGGSPEEYCPTSSVCRRIK